MSGPTVSLVTIATGPLFERYANELYVSAFEHFHASERWEWHQLESEPGWPAASLTRYRTILANADRIRGRHLFLSDADNIFEGPVGPEILSEGIVVTTHPGYPEPTNEAPFERRRESRACVDPGVSEGHLYHPGAFVGGSRAAFLEMAETIDAWIREDQTDGITAVWHDESYLNRWLIAHPPALVLDRRYCWWEHWGNAAGEGLIVHRDKTAAEFAERGAYGSYA